MTVEQKIQKVLDNDLFYPLGMLRNHQCCSINTFPWEEKPYSLTIATRDICPFYNKYTIEFQMDIIINKSDKVECLTSTSNYIRQAKRWMMNHDFNKELKKAYKKLHLVKYYVYKLFGKLDSEIILQVNP